MNAGDLIKKLEEVPPKWTVVLSADEEGNHFHELFEVETENSVFNEDNEVKLHHLTPELRARRYTEEDVDDGQRCVVLWP